MFSNKVARLLFTGGRHTSRCMRKRALSTTVNPALDQDNFILRRDLELHIPDATVPDIIWKNLDRWADKIATESNETGRSYTYAELRRRSNNLAKALRGRLKLEHGSTVGILLPNVPEYALTILGIMEAGLIATTINPIYKPDEISRQLIDSDTKVLITLGEYHKKAVDSIREANKSIPIITIKNAQDESIPAGAINFDEFCDSETNFTDLQHCRPDDIVLMPYSSGTTGLPKGVELTHKNIVANIIQSVDLDKVIAQTTKDNQDIIPAVLPMFHIYGISVNVLNVLHLGCKSVTISKFTPDIYTDMLLTHKPQHLFLVPPLVLYLAAHPSISKQHLDSVKTIISGAAPLGATDVERLFEKTGREILALQGFGMTESSPVLTFTPPEIWKECLGSIGMVCPQTELKVVLPDDKTGTPLGPTEQGEFCVRGPQVMTRYHNNPKATEEVFQDGWLKTGDMGYYDDKKIVWITDRLKELIKVKGFQVAPAELEAIIRNHPDVGDAAVIGIPHPIYGEVPKAFIVPKENKEVVTDDVRDYVAQRVASYKKLEGGITVLDVIPKNASGKIMRKTLREKYTDE